MTRIGTVASSGTARSGTRPSPSPGTPAGDGTTGRALVILDGGRQEARAPSSPGRGGRAEPGFVAQLLVARDPSLRPSRTERARAAADRYAAAARRLA